MRKLNILKAIVDFVCIMSYITVPILIILFGYFLISDQPITTYFKINGSEVTNIDLSSKIIMILFLISFLLIVYSIFLFRKILLSFQKIIIFDEEIIKNFKNIGILLITSGLISGITEFIFNMSQHKINFEIGLNSFVIICILGLFSMVLSEVFTIAKKQKEENELTI
jgi:hypothetical protein